MKSKPKPNKPAEEAVDETPKELPPHPELPRGPADRRAMSEAEPDPNDTEAEPEFDFSILNHIQGRLWKKGPFAEPILALEILDGPYKGIVYSYSSFTFLPGMTQDGMVPTKYETEVHVIPDSLKDTFVKDEAFDVFTSEVLISWIGYIHTNDLTPLLKVRTRGIH